MSKATTRDIQRSKACTCFPGGGGRARPFPNDLQCRCGFRSQDMRASKAEGDKDDYSAARKNITRVLQVMTPLHVMDRVVAFLLLRVGKSDAEQSWMTGYEIIVTLDCGARPRPSWTTSNSNSFRSYAGNRRRICRLGHLGCQKHQDDNA